MQVCGCFGLLCQSRIRGVLTSWTSHSYPIYLEERLLELSGLKGLCQPGFLQCNVVIISPGLGDNYVSATDMHTRVLTGLRRLIRDSQSGDSIQVTWPVLTNHRPVLRSPITRAIVVSYSDHIFIIELEAVYPNMMIDWWQIISCGLKANERLEPWPDDQ